MAASDSRFIQRVGPEKVKIVPRSKAIILVHIVHCPV